MAIRSMTGGVRTTTATVHRAVYRSMDDHNEPVPPKQVIFLQT